MQVEIKTWFAEKINTAHNSVQASSPVLRLRQG